MGEGGRLCAGGGEEDRGVGGGERRVRVLTLVNKHVLLDKHVQLYQHMQTHKHVTDNLYIHICIYIYAYVTATYATLQYVCLSFQNGCILGSKQFPNASILNHTMMHVTKKCPFSKWIITYVNVCVCV